MHQNRFLLLLGLCPSPRSGSDGAPPDTYFDLGGSTSEGGEGKGREETAILLREGKGRKGEGREGFYV